MKILQIVDNSTKKVTHVIPITVPEPHDFLFVKDRETKERFIMIRTHGEDPYYGHKQLQKVPYDQYSDVSLEIQELK